MNDREQFEAAVCGIVPRPLFSCNEDGSYQEVMVRGFWSLWLAARATPAQPVAQFGEDAIFMLRKQPNGERWPVGTKLYVAQPSHPSSVSAAILALPLPEDKFCAWMQNGRPVNAFKHGVGDPKKWDSDGYFAADGYSRSPLYTGDQVRALLSEAAALAEQVQGQQTALSEEQIREKFEAWATSQKDKYIGLKLNSWRYNDGSRWYKYERTQHMYEGFRATFDAAPSIPQDGQKSEGA
jgi:hypothetical protein